MNYNKINNIYDMLQGNINRMIVSKSLEELDTMYSYALQRLEIIYEEKKKDLEK